MCKIISVSIHNSTFCTTFSTPKMHREVVRYTHETVFAFTGKELDAETGYSYFGARYYGPATLTAWLSVDPMSDKYPSISPYAYCAWNPIKLVDPDGRDTFCIDISRGKIFQQTADGNHCIKIFASGRDGNYMELQDLRVENISRESLSYEKVLYRNGADGYGSTSYLKFSDGNLGFSIFQNVIGQSDNLLGENAMEWDFYSLNDGGGELSSSGQFDKMIHSPDRYTKDNTRLWDHYHPGSDESYHTSISDQNNARRLGVPCYMNNNGTRFRFDDLIPRKSNGDFVPNGQISFPQEKKRYSLYR